MKKESPRARLAGRIRRARTRKGWTQQKCADRIGVSFVTWSRWETGFSAPLPAFRFLLARLLGVKV